VEAVLDRVGVRLVAEMPLTRKVCREAVLLEEFGNGRRFFAQRVLVAWGNHNRQRRANGDAPCHERRTARGAARLTVPVREQSAFLSNPIEVGGRMTERRTAP